MFDGCFLIMIFKKSLFHVFRNRMEKDDENLVMIVVHVKSLKLEIHGKIGSIVVVVVRTHFFFFFLCTINVACLLDKIDVASKMVSVRQHNVVKSMVVLAVTVAKTRYPKTQRV
jgi:hypothetical protein